MAGAFLLRAWRIEAEEYQFEMDQRYRDLLGHDRGLVGPRQLHHAEMHARLAAASRPPADLLKLARQRRHEASQHFNKYWTINLDELRQWTLLNREADGLVKLAHEMEAAGQRVIDTGDQAAVP